MHYLLMTLALAAPADTPPVTALAYTPDGRTLLAGMNRQVVVIDINSADVGRRMEMPGPVTGMVVAPDGKSFIAATGQPGQRGELHVFPLPAKDGPRIIKAHADLLYGLAISGDGQHVATGSYDRLVKLWNVADGQELRTLKDHSDAVNGVAFQPKGSLLASVAADRTVKVWDSASGKRLYTLAEATEALTALAFSPDGQRLAAGGADKSIRIWDVNAAEGKLVTSFFAHDGEVMQLAFTGDGKALVSLGRDRVVKVWSTEDYKELRHFGPMPGEPMVLAWRPDGKQFAIGQHDGSVTIHDAKSGKVTATPLPEKPKLPLLDALTPNGAQRGTTLSIRFTGDRLDFVTELISDHADTKIKLVAQTRTTIDAEVTLGGAMEPGFVTFSAKSPAGESKPVRLAVDLFPLGRPEAIAMNHTMAGQLARPGAIDEFTLQLPAGQDVAVLVTIPPESKMEPVLEWVDAEHQLRGTGTTTLSIPAGTGPQGTLRVRDRDYRGGKAFAYRLHVGHFPLVQSVYPLGAQRGQSTEFKLTGVNLPQDSVNMTIPADAEPNKRLPLSVHVIGPRPTVVVGEFPEVADQSRAIPVPGTANGIISADRHVWRFTAKQGQPLIIEALAQRYGSPLDPQLEILDDKGQPIECARLQCVAKTVTNLRDHPANGANIRLENWNEFAVDDFVWMGQELVRIAELPGHPDADCDFYAVGGRRQTFLGTTPGWHPIGTVAYKVRIHPPRTTLASNGFPVIPLYYRNDDGGPGYGKDARIIFDPPADGRYQVVVTDARGQSGPHHAYRLTIRPPQPDFSVKASPDDPVIEAGGARAINVTIDRIDGFDGPVSVKLDALPDGLACPPTIVESGQTKATLALFAPNPPKVASKEPLTVVASATIAEQSIVHKTKVGPPRFVGPGDIVTKVEQSSVPLRPGQETHFQVRIERRHGFTGRVPMEVKNLPHGVRVMHIGLNGIMITEKETTRTIVLGCELWVGEMTVPILVVAKREDTNSEHAAPPVLLHIQK